MAAEDDFLSQIIERPDDDEPRLAFAAFLDLHDPPRGELIRVQCDLAKLARDDARRSDLRRRENELLDGHRDRWLEPLRPWIADAGFSRGMVETILIEPEALQDGIEPVFSRAPVRRLVLGQQSPPAGWVGAIANKTHLEKLATLDLMHCVLSDEELEKLLGSTVLRNLRQISFNDSNCTFATARALATASHLRRLQRLLFLGFEEEGITDAGVGLLAECEHLSSLEELDLRENRLTSAAALSLAESPWLRELKLLNFGDGRPAANQIGADGAEHLAASSNFRRLRSLHLDFNGIGDDGLIALAGSRELPSLCELDVVSNDITERGVRELAASGLASQLKSLDLGSNKIGDAGLAPLVNEGALGRLEVLSLCGCGLSSAALEIIGSANALPALKRLRLSANDLQDPGYKWLTTSTAFDRLDKLFLDRYRARLHVDRLTARFGDRLILEGMVLPSMHQASAG